MAALASFKPQTEAAPPPPLSDLGGRAPKFGMKGNRITLEDIAKRVGVTKMTVSRYITNPSKVAKATGLKIKAAIDEMGYIPNRAPVMLSQASTKTIGLMVSSFSNLLFSDLIEGAEARARKAGYEILIGHTSYREDEEERKISQLMSYQVDAMILTDAVHTPQTIKRLKMSKIPVVELMSLVDNPIDMNIGYHHAKISYAAIKGLIECGRRNIMYLAARMDSRTMDRQSGYLTALKEFNLTPHIYGSENPSNFTIGAMTMRKALMECPNVDAVFCTNDDVAIGAMIACIEQGVSVPDDISILGYNGLDIGNTTIPKLTSIRTARYDMGKSAVELILMRLRNDDSAETHMELTPMLSLGQTLTLEENQAISRNFDTLYALKLPPLVSADAALQQTLMDLNRMR